MDDTTNLWVLLEECLRSSKIAQVHLLEGGTYAGNLFDAVYDICLTVAQVISDDHLITSVLQLDSRVAANKSRTSGYQYSFFHRCLYIFKG